MTPPPDLATGPAEAEAPLGAGIDFTDPHSPLAPLYFQAGHVTAAALVALVFLFFSFIPLWHTDVWGHLNFGRWVAEHGRLPEREPFCARSDPDAPALHAYWLFQCGFYRLYQAGGALAGGDAVRRLEGGAEVLRTTLALVLALRCLVLLLAFRRLGAPFPLACLLLVVMLAASVGHITVMRPQAVGELCFAGVLLALSRPVLSRLALVGLPLLLALWANVHGSYPSGLILLGLFLAGRVVSACWGVGSLNPLRALADTQARRLLLALLLSTAAVACLNPHGVYVFRGTVLLGHHPNVQFMDEWQPMDLTRPGALAMIYVASLVALAAAQLVSARWLTPGQVLVLAAFAAGPLFHLRMMIWWFMVAAWLLAAQWPGVRTQLPPRWLALRTVPSFRKTLMAVALVLILLSLSPAVQWATSGRPTARERVLFAGTPWKLADQLASPDRPGELPALAAALKERYPGGRLTGCLFASETLGDYLVWALAPGADVFLYTHVHLFPFEVWRDCAAVKFGAANWREVLDRRRVNLLAFEPDQYPRLHALVRQDGDWLVVLDEAGDPAKRDTRARHFVALRKVPR
jgi:hypothetical protein